VLSLIWFERMPVFDSILNKIQEVSLSDINHELGKAKESLVYESSSYLQNIKEDAASVGSLIRSESTRFGDYFGRRKTGLPKSTSLPVIQPRDPCSPCTKDLGVKYKYRSTAEPHVPIVATADLVDQDSVVSRFIKVVGASDNVESCESAKTFGGEEGAAALEPQTRRRADTREDIRRKLASFGDDEEEEVQATENNNLEICFINETAVDDNEDNVCINPLGEVYSSEEETEEEEEDDFTPSFPRSKSVWESFRNPDSVPAASEEEEAEERRKRREEREEKRKRKYQRAARVALAQCGQVARRQLQQEKEERIAGSRLKKLVGLNHSEINATTLQPLSIPKLQVILNDFRESIENYNSELVQLLMNKDELQSEQESMLIDIEDISQPR